MTATLINRAKVTDAVLARFVTDSVLVGDAAKPAEPSGWVGEISAPGAQFIPYSVLTAASAGAASGPIDDSQTLWQLSFRVDSYGVTRAQCEIQADKTRSSMAKLQRTEITDGAVKYNVQQVKVLGLGGIVRVDLTDPSYFGQSDLLAIWVAKE